MTFKLGDAKGLAVYEMPVQGEVQDDALVAFAEEAIRGAAVTVSDKVTISDLCEVFRGPVGVGTLRAEALVMRRNGTSMRVAADILAGGSRVASFEADALTAA
jgi:hypothetical protein